MKIALVNNYFNPTVVGGAEIVAELLAKGLAVNGHDVQVFCSHNSKADEIKGPIPIHRNTIANLYWPPDKTAPTPPQKLLWHFFNLYNPITVKRIVSSIKKFNPDIIHLHNISIFTSALYTEIRKKLPDVPVIQTLHDYWHACIKNTLLHRNGKICTEKPALCSLRSTFIFNKAKIVNKFVSPSHFLKDYYINNKLIPDERIEVIPNALPKKDITDSQKRKSVQKDLAQKIIFLYLGQLEAHKGIHVLLDAIRQIKKKDHIEFIFAGRGQLEKIIKNEKDIRYIGYLSGKEKEDILSASDVLILPSLWYENYPLVAIEACNYGLAIIGSKLGGIPEIVTDGWNGKLVSPGNSGQLSQAIATIASDRSLLHSWQNHSFKFAEKFKLDNMIDRHIRLYKSLI